MALKKFALNMAALSGARVLQAISSFVAIPVLARLLTPEQFGLVAMAGTFVWLTTAISDAGLGQTLVRIDRSERTVWSSAFWFLTMLGAVLAGLLALIAFPVAWAMQESRLTLVLLALAPIPLIQAALATSAANLQQREQFRHLAAAELLGSLGGTIAALGLAFGGAGVWALVFQLLVYWLIKSAVILSASTFKPTFEFKMSVLGPHVRFSRDTGILGLVAFFSHQIDPVVIGRLIGTGAVGMYSLASRVAYLPMQFISFPLQNALYTRMVVLRENKAAIRNLLLVSSWVIAAIVFPGMAIAAASSGAYFEVLFTAKWLAAAPVFAAFAPVIAVQVLLAMLGSMLQALGETGRRLRLSVEFMVLWLIVLPITALLTHSVLAIAIAYTASYILFSIRRYPLYLEAISTTARDYFANLSKPLIVALAAAAVQVALARLWQLPPVHEIALSIVVLLASYATIALLEWRGMGERIAVMREILADRHLKSEAEAEAPQPI